MKYKGIELEGLDKEVRLAHSRFFDRDEGTDWIDKLLTCASAEVNVQAADSHRNAPIRGEMKRNGDVGQRNAHRMTAGHGASTAPWPAHIRYTPDYMEG